MEFNYLVVKKQKTYAPYSHNLVIGRGQESCILDTLCCSHLAEPLDACWVLPNSNTKLCFLLAFDTFDMSF